MGSFLAGQAALQRGLDARGKLIELEERSGAYDKDLVCKVDRFPGWKRATGPRRKGSRMAVAHARATSVRVEATALSLSAGKPQAYSVQPERKSFVVKSLRYLQLARITGWMIMQDREMNKEQRAFHYESEQGRMSTRAQSAQISVLVLVGAGAWWEKARDLDHPPLSFFSPATRRLIVHRRPPVVFASISPEMSLWKSLHGTKPGLGPARGGSVSVHRYATDIVARLDLGSFAALMSDGDNEWQPLSDADRENRGHCRALAPHDSHTTGKPTFLLSWFCVVPIYVGLGTAVLPPWDVRDVGAVPATDFSQLTRYNCWDSSRMAGSSPSGSSGKVYVDTGLERIGSSSWSVGRAGRWLARATRADEWLEQLERDSSGKMVSSSQEVTAPDFEASAEFEDSPLQDYSGPVPDNNVDSSAPTRRTQVTVPTLKPLSKIGNNAQILARRTEALAKGASGTGKDFLLTATKASRRLYQHVFPKEFQLLDALLTEVEILQLFGMGAGYRVEKDQFRLLLRILQKLRAIAEDSFTVDGKTPPPLPTWGDDEDILEVYDQNAFEILGVCFRVEVENFLVLLDKYYDYHEGKPQERHIDLDKAADEFIRTHKSLSVADLRRIFLLLAVAPWFDSASCRQTLTFRARINGWGKS
ncbi:hypothetical protein DFH06DRAFT_1134167 [Mycena polygramma]|nr:hypothetical protein DFH06DRAFT_1134167 [Mycena polygramma]